MVDKSAEKEPKKVMFVDSIDENQWATYDDVRDGQVTESFKVPFTQQELDCIKRVKEASSHPGLIKGYTNGGPEREHLLALRIPFSHGLDNRKRAIDMLRHTAVCANKILKEDIFTPGLNSREAIITIKDLLSPLIPKEPTS